MDERAEIARKVREPKTRLIEIDSELYRSGFEGSSRSLGKIIAQLERWEARHA
jgi:hypothetical protein